MKRTRTVSAGRSAGSSGVITTLEWLGYLVVTIIPVIGLVMCFVWAFGSGNLNRRNLFRAVLIIMAASIVLGLIFGSVVTPFYQNIIKSLGIGA